MSSGLSSARLSRMHATLAAYVEHGELPGLVTLLARRGEVHVDTLGAQAIGGEAMRRDTIFRISSMTKPITAVAAMVLVEECKLRLDDPVDRLLPELANRRVLQQIDAPLDDTVPAKRPISLRDLLTSRMGFGSVMATPGTYPIQRALSDYQLGGDGLPQPAQMPSADEWMRRLGSMPLMHQPGERWLYNTAFDVLGVLIARATGQPFAAFLRERIFEPLGMRDTGFSVPADKLGRLATSYEADAETGALQLYDTAAGGQWSSPPPFESGAGGLVSTVDDYLAFCRMLLNKGKLDSTRILSRPAVELMISDQVTLEQRTGAEIFFRDSSSWGFGMAVYTRRDDLMAGPGRFGWDGGLGSSAYSDPAEDLVGILLTQCAWTSPSGPQIWNDFWTSAYAAIDD
ncbi:MAG: beta-lactamase family protein [Chloroflexales bacterium]|nr:beta-lactamase family protein [Chloroflexales bacterium]